MKRIAGIIALFALGLMAGAASAQTVTLQGATPHAVVLTWKAPTASGGWAGCTSSAPCTYQLYSLPGSCPATLVGSSGWTALPITSGVTLTDSSEAAGATVSYVAYTLQGGNQSAPSSCVTVTVPLDPLPPTGLQG